MSALSVEGVTKSYGSTPVLRAVDLEVAEGSFSAVLGPSGSGKTTLLRVAAGFERIAAGRVSVGGEVVDDGRRYVTPERRRIGYVPQEGALFPHLSVAANVAFGLPRAERKGPTVDRMLELVGLTGLAKRHPHELSGGQQQRVALARALARGPSLVLLDEPFSALDASLRSSVRAEVLAVIRETGTTAVLVTHDQDEALSMSDHVAVLRAGVVVQAGSPRELYAHPVDADLAFFLGDASTLPGTGEGGGARTSLGLLETTSTLAAGAPTTVLVRPEQVRLVRGDQATVVGCAYFGHDALVTLDVAGQPLLARVPGATAPSAGSTVGVELTGPFTSWSS